MHLLARICACVLTLLVCVELTVSQLPTRPSLMPTEKAALAYLHEQRDAQLPLLTQLAERIHSQQEADDAVYELAEYLRARAEAFCKLSVEPLTPTQATERFQHILAAEAELMQSDASTVLLCEDKRLRVMNFYHSSSLRALWESYAVVLTPQGFRLPWMPNSEHALKRLSLPPADAEITLLTLDAFARAGFRGDITPQCPFAVPAVPNLRGAKRLFADCFCPRYCFHAETTPAPKALSGAPSAWAPSSPRNILALTPQAARDLPALQAERRTAHDTFFIYRLTPPFRSAHLVIIYPADSKRPASFIFSDDISEYDRSPQALPASSSA